MPATELHLTIEQGATFSQTLTVGTTFNGLTPRAQLRDGFTGALLATFACTTVSSGQTTISLTATETAALPVPAWVGHQRRFCLGIYDVEVPGAASAVTRTHEGNAYLSREATR